MIPSHPISSLLEQTIPDHDSDQGPSIDPAEGKYANSDN
jgi:hypothetical protein